MRRIRPNFFQPLECVPRGGDIVLTRALKFEDFDGRLITVHPGFQTCLSHRVLGGNSRLHPAYTVHDWGYRFDRDRGKFYWDGVLWRALGAVRCPNAVRLMIYLHAYWLGWRAWGRAGRG